jgi:hypothetical protein
MNFQNNNLFVIQSILFDSMKTPMEDALLWSIARNFRPIDVTIEGSNFKFKLHPKLLLKSSGYNKKIKKMVDEEKGIVFILFYKDNPIEEKSICCPLF